MSEDAAVTVGSTVLGRYRLDRELGAGGMGVVWLATDTVLEQRVALKKVSFAHLGDEQAALMRDRTLREARLAARLRGARHVVALYDVQVAAGAVWLVMEYHPSRSLAEFVATGGTLNPAAAAGIGADLAAALAHAHGMDVQHRDVTPGNVLIGDDGVVKLTDFGIAHQTGERRLTQTGVVTGTISYLAPEVARGYEAGTAADVFSLGSTLYYAVEGIPPFGTDGSEMQLLHLVSAGNIRPPEQAGELTPLLLRMLELNPATRPDARTLQLQFTRLAGRPEPVPVHPPPAPYLPAPPPQTTPPPARSVTPAPLQPVPERRFTSSVRVRSRWAALAAGLLVLAVVAVLASVVGRPISGTPQAGPSATGDPAALADGGPARTGQIMLPEDPRSVDTCQLISKPALGRFGIARIVRGAYYEGCIARINSGRDEATVELFMDPAGTGGGEGQVVPLGGIQLIRRATNNPKSWCGNEIVLSDAAVIYVNGYPTYDDEPDTPDLCTMVRTATDAATQVLAGVGGLPTSPDARGNQPLARQSACDLLDMPALRTVRGLDAARTSLGYANWACNIGSGSDGDPQVRLNFLRMTAEDLAGFGDRTIVGGHTSYVREEDGVRNPKECYVRVQFDDPGGSTPADVLGVEVDATAPVATMCAAAKRIAVGALRRLPS